MNENNLKIYLKGLEAGIKLEKEFNSDKIEISGSPTKIYTKKYKKRGPQHIWTPEEDQAIRELSISISDKKIAEKLNTNGPAISARRVKLGIIKGKGFNSKILKEDYTGLANLNQKLEN